MGYKFLCTIIFFGIPLVMKAERDCPSMGRRLWGDFANFQKNIFTTETIKIFAAWTPFYVMGRVLDKPLQRNFYSPRLHKNIHQMPNGLYYTLEAALAASIAGLVTLSVIGHDGQRKRTAQLYTVTLPCLWILKTIIKQIPFKGNLRPPNGCFKRCKKYYGGFPSGHMFEMTYTAALFGSRLGRKYSIPLGILTGAIGLEFMNCNRHYISQIVAGIGLGLIFASAGKRALDKPDPRRWCYTCVPDGDGIGIRATLNF